MGKHVPRKTAPMYILRKHLGLSVRPLALRLGISHECVYQAERGGRITVDTYYQIKKAARKELKSLHLKGAHFVFGSIKEGESA